MYFKTALTAAALAISAFAADAASVTFNYQLTGLTGDVAHFGLSRSDTIDVTVTYNTGDSIYREGTYDNSYYTYDYASYYAYRNTQSSMETTVRVGNQTFVSTSYSDNYYDYLYVRDGIANGTSTISDYAYHYDYSSDGNGDSMYIYTYGYSRALDTFSGLSPEAKITQNQPESYAYGYFQVISNGVRKQISANTLILNNGVSPVPLPASGVLLLAGLGGVAAFKRRQRS